MGSGSSSQIEMRRPWSSLPQMLDHRVPAGRGEGVWLITSLIGVLQRNNMKVSIETEIVIETALHSVQELVHIILEADQSTLLATG